MVIAPGTKGITAHVILADGESVPSNLNKETVVIYRRGKSTNMELELVKSLGVVLEAGHEALRDKSAPVCNYNGDGNPLHEHADGTFWFYEETWAYENGPFPTYDEAYSALAEYCVGLETARQVAAEMTEDDNVVISEEVPETKNANGVVSIDSGRAAGTGADAPVDGGVES